MKDTYKINIAEDFSTVLGGRFKHEGSYSGKVFRDNILMPVYGQAFLNNNKIEINLDRCYGYPPSFIEEVFGGIVRKTKDTNIIDMFIFISEDLELINKIKQIMLLEIIKLINNKNKLFLLWESRLVQRYIIIGELCKYTNGYIFKYSDDIEFAIDNCFSLLLPFKNKKEIYTSEKLFPIFKNRLPDKNRKDIDNILKKYNLKKYDEFEILKFGTQLPIDNLKFIEKDVYLQKK